MTDVSRRAFLGGVAGAATIAGGAVALEPVYAAEVPAAKKPKFHALARDKVYSLKFFRAGKGKQWMVGPMKLRLVKLQAIQTGDGVTRLHESAFVAIFKLTSGPVKNGGMFTAFAPDGTKFPLSVVRVSPMQNKGTVYAAVINRWVPVK